MSLINYFLVCKAAIAGMENEIKKVDPRKRVDVGGFRLDQNGQAKTKSIPYSKSETYLTELMESICNSPYTRDTRTHFQILNNF